MELPKAGAGLNKEGWRKMSIVEGPAANPRIPSRQSRIKDMQRSLMRQVALYPPPTSRYKEWK